MPLLREYDLPPISDEAAPGTKDYEIIQWAEGKLVGGVKFLESQIGYDKIDIALNEIFAYEQSSSSSYVPGPKPLSQTRANLMPKIAEDLTAMLTDVRMFWKYSTENKRYERQVELSNKSAKDWYGRLSIDLRIGDCVKYWTFAGTAYAHLFYSRRMDDMMVEAVDPRNVFPIDPISTHTLEDCLGVIYRKSVTPAWIKEEYGKTVSPSTGGVVGRVFGWLTRSIIEGPGERGGPLSSGRKLKGDKPIPGSPTCFLNTMYLKDKRTNPKSFTVKLGPWVDGKPDSPWSYEVPPGEPLFPFGRMVVWCNGVMLYDGPAPYWHGEFPLIKLTLNPWPMSWFGKAPMWDCIPLQTSMTSNLRVIDDHAAQVAQPGVVADRNVSKSEVNKFNSRAPGWKIRTNQSSGKGIQVVYPQALDQLIWEVIKWCEEKMKTITGTVDVEAMAGLNQIPSQDTIDTIMKAMTPAIRLRSRILEGFYKQLAKQFLYCNAEFDTLTKRVLRFGPDAATKEDFDFIPGSFIPDHVPDGEPGDIASTEQAMAADKPLNLYQRAKILLMAIATNFDPSSLLNSAAMQELMQYFMLAKMGYTSVFTIMEKMGISSFAPPGLKIPPDEISRLQLQQQLGIGMIANAQGRKATDSTPPSMGQNANGPTLQTS